MAFQLGGVTAGVASYFKRPVPLAAGAGGGVLVFAITSKATSLGRGWCVALAVVTFGGVLYYMNAAAARKEYKAALAARGVTDGMPKGQAAMPGP